MPITVCSFDPARLDPNNPPPSPWTLQASNPDLLNALAEDFVASNYDVKHLMRLIAADSARFHGRAKRGGGWQRIALEDSEIPSSEREFDVLALHEALNHLSEIDSRKVQVLEMRFFGGLTNNEIAVVLNVSVDTVKRDWNFARLWLSREMKK